MAKKVAASVQKFMQIAEIKDDTLVMKDGTMRAVLLVSSVNFSLKSEEEQDAMVSGYISFLNSLNFQIQVVIQSRRLDLDHYLAELDNRQKEQTNELLKLQIQEYIQFVRELVQLGEIMTKRFYVTVPFHPTTAGGKQGFMAMLSEIFSAASVVQLKRSRFLEYKEVLDRRLGYVQGGLASMGLHSVRLNTQSLIELFYKTYNPLESKTQKLPPMEELQLAAPGEA